MSKREEEREKREREEDQSGEEKSVAHAGAESLWLSMLSPVLRRV